MLKTNLLILLFIYLPVSVYAAEPDFALPDLNGKIHHLSDYRGKWVIVNYWATWCPPCREEIPQLEAFYNANRRDAVVLGVNYEDNDPASLKSFVDEHMITYPILLADVDRPTVFGRLYGLPTSFIVSPQGKLVQSRTGPVTRQYLESVIGEYDKRNNVVMR
ncbi:MAG: TlpA disulfide reductase family protein [Gammaproteobacteria bacterium]|jgi:thiol-disulfide isomerase/thioredoxin